MEIGIIGSGEMGKCLASAFVKLRHNVSIANSRGPETLEAFAEESGAVAAKAENAIAGKDIVVVSVPQKNIPDLPTQWFKRLSDKAVVIDTGNYYPTLRDGTIAALEQSNIDSLWVQRQLGFPVVKVFNSILATSLAALGRPKGENRIALAVSGDGKRAKEIVFSLVDSMGFDAFDTGTISDSWKQQPGSPIYCRDISAAEMRRRARQMDERPEMHDTILMRRKSDEALMATDYPAYLKTLT